MPAKGGFWALVKQDFKWNKRSKLRMPKTWRILYALAVAIAVVVLTTYASLERHLTLNDVWFLILYLPFASYGLSIGSMKQEWKNGTFGWWLTLPVSRLRLLSSKFVAIVLRFVLFVVGIYCAISLLGVYTLLLQGGDYIELIGPFLITGLKWSALTMAICPFATAFGILYSVVRESTARPATPLLWLVFGGTWWIVFSQGDHLAWMGVSADQYKGISLSLNLLYPFGISWLLAYLMIRLAARLLERNLAL